MNVEKRKPNMTIIVPVFNEEQTLTELFNHLDKLKAKLTKLDISFLFINDGSTDNSLKILEGLSNKYKYVKIISFTRNFGHQAAIAAGINFCTDDYAVIIDADLQDPPNEIENLYLKSLEGYDVVHAKRVRRIGETYFKKITAVLFYKLFNYLSDTKIPNNVGDFKLINKKVLNELKKLKEKNKFIRGLVPWTGFKSTYHEYERNERFAGHTKYNIFQMLKLAIDGSISFSSKIINFFSILSILITSLSFLFGIYLIIYKLIYLNKIIPGFTALITCIIFFSGTILMFLSIIAQYIIRIQVQVKDRPEYVIKQIVNL